MSLKPKLGFLQQNLQWEKRKAVVPRLIRDLSPDPSGFSVEPRGRQRFAPQHTAARGGNEGRSSKGGGPSYLSLSPRRRASVWPPGAAGPHRACPAPPAAEAVARAARPHRRGRPGPRGGGGGTAWRRWHHGAPPRTTGTRRRPGTLQEAVRRAGQEAAGRRVRRKLLPPARRALWCGAGLGRRAGGVPAGRLGHPGPVHHPRRGHPTNDPELGRCQRPLAPSVQRLQCSFLGCEPSVLGCTEGFPSTLLQIFFGIEENTRQIMEFHLFEFVFIFPGFPYNGPWKPPPVSF